MTALTAEFEQKLSDIYSHLPYDDSSEMDPPARPGPSRPFRHLRSSQCDATACAVRHWSGQCLGDDTPLLLGLTEDARFQQPACNCATDEAARPPCAYPGCTAYS